MKPRLSSAKTLPALCASLFLWVCVCGEEAAAFEWTRVQHNGREYVTAQNIKDYYGFESYSVSSNTLKFRSPTIEMHIDSGAEYLYVNDVKFYLSHRINYKGRQHLFSWLDLEKVIDPVLRPTRIDTPRLITTIVIDPGHGGKDTGSRSIYGNESEYNLRLGLMLKRELELRGFRVRMTRTGDTFPTLAGRVVFANRVPDSLFISLHFNHHDSRSAKGIETFALVPKGLTSSRSTDGRSLMGNARDAENIALASTVHAHLLKKTRTRDRGIKRDRFTVLAGINKPGILVEGGFLSNPDEARNIASTSYLSLMAAGIADACVMYRNAARR
jgi:N-acetylmuramoyl-L-alanine amidase